MVYKVSEGKSRPFTSYLSKEASCLEPESNAGMSIPHSASFLDLDGDCMPDLFLTKQRSIDSTLFYEIYI
jgi:hypothetical protein